MLMMCWYYCIPFAKGLFFASSFLLVLFALFILKRGVRRARPGLRQAAFVMIFIAMMKVLTIDLYLLRQYILCDVLDAGCSQTGVKLLQAAGLVVLVAGSAFLLHVYRGFIRERRVREIMPEENGLRFWCNLSMGLVLLQVCWLAVPWVAYLTVGRMPAFFVFLPWQYVAFVNVAVLLIAFWKLEDCNWLYDPAATNKKRYQVRVWTPKDTLGLSTILLLMTLAFSYASHDVLSLSGKTAGRGHLSLKQIDIGQVPGFQMPEMSR